MNKITKMTALASCCSVASCQEWAQFPVVQSHKSPVYKALDEFTKNTADALNINFDQIAHNFEHASDNFPCFTCQSMTAFAQYFYDALVDETLLVEASYGLCGMVVPKIGFHPSMCKGVIDDQLKDSILPIFRHQVLSERNICTFALQLCDLDGWQKLDVVEYVMDQMSKKNKKTLSNDFINKLYQQKREQKGFGMKKPIKLALISDLHIDFDYTPGADNKCGKPLCCRKDSGIAPSEDRKAGQWGDFNCDSSPKMVESMLYHIKHNVKPDAVLWAGDSMPHVIARNTPEETSEILTRVSQLVSKGLDGISVYPALGNHDTYPQDYFDLSKPRNSDVFNKWSHQWSSFIKDEKALKKFMDYGYYSIPLQRADGTHIGKGETRIIAINTNVCYSFNFVNFVTFTDPGHQIEWLEKELEELESVGGTAIMLAHVPDGPECTRQFGKRYHALMDRFQHVVRWGMYGHYHQELFSVVRDMMSQKPIMTNFIVGSVTTFTGLVPSFGIVTLDPDTMLPLDFETQAFHLTHANKFNQPRWINFYNWRQDYQMVDLSPASFQQVSSRILLDRATCHLFRNHKVIGGPAAHRASMINDDLSLAFKNEDNFCDYRERLDLYCQTVGTDYDEFYACKQAQGKTNWLDWFAQNWYAPNH